MIVDAIGFWALHFAASLQVTVSHLPAAAVGYSANWLGLPLQRQGCAEETLTSVKLACLIRPTDTVIQRQHLFTVYVHPSKSFEGATGLLCLMITTAALHQSRSCDLLDSKGFVEMGQLLSIL